jgi:hypothetical protein
MAQFACAPIARRECFIFALFSAVPDRTHGMNHMPRRQPITSGDLGIAGCAAMEGAAFRQQFWSGRAVDRTIHATATEQRRIRGVDDGVNAKCRDIGDGDFQPCRADLASG